MSKVALVFSGLPRFLHKCSENIVKNIIEPNDADVFIHTYDDKITSFGKHRDMYNTARPTYDFNLDEELIRLYSPKQLLIESTNSYTVDSNYMEPSTLPISIANVQYMFNSFNKSIGLIKKYSETTGIKYDVIIRCRFDAVTKNKILIKNNHNTLNCVMMRHHGIDSYVSDQFFYGDSDTMYSLSDIIFNIRPIYERIGIYNPEIILTEYIKSNKILINPVLTLDDIFIMNYPGSWTQNL